MASWSFHAPDSQTYPHGYAYVCDHGKQWYVAPQLAPELFKCSCLEFEQDREAALGAMYSKIEVQEKRWEKTTLEGDLHAPDPNEPPIVFELRERFDLWRYRWVPFAGQHYYIFVGIKYEGDVRGLHVVQIDLIPSTDERERREVWINTSLPRPEIHATLKAALLYANEDFLMTLEASRDLFRFRGALAKDQREIAHRTRMAVGAGLGSEPKLYTPDKRPNTFPTPIYVGLM